MYESVYWVNANNDRKSYKKCSICLEFKQTEPKEKTIHNDIPMRPWGVIGADVFQLNNKNYLCIVNYHSTFPVIKWMDGLSAESLITAVKIIFTEYVIPHRLMSDAGSNFISEKFKNFCNSLNIEQAVLSLYHHQSNSQVEACIKLIKCTIKKCSDSGGDIHMALLQIRITHLGQGLLSWAMLLFNHLVKGIMPLIDRKPISMDNDDEHNKNLMHRQGKNGWHKDTSKIFTSIPMGSTVAVQWEDGGLSTHGTIIGKGNHNHHNRSYKIQVTNTGRIITHNRKHIKPTPITTADFLHYQANKHTKTDLLDAIFDHILRHPPIHTDWTITRV